MKSTNDKITSMYWETLKRFPTEPNNIREKVRGMLEHFEKHPSEKLQFEIEQLTGLTGDYMAMDEGEPPAREQE